MYLSNLIVKGYKLFRKSTKICFNPGLTVLVGENSSGKSAVIDAIRLLLLEDEYRLRVSSSDFHRPLDLSARVKGADEFSIRCVFEELSEKEQIAYLPWLNADNSKQAIINLKVENKEDQYGRFKRSIWGGDSISGIFEWELLNAISCIYLPPLRDAEDKLRAYRGSRLARLLKNLKKDISNEVEHPLERKITEFNKSLLKENTIDQANRSIKKYLHESIGTLFGQDTIIQFSESKFDRIVESLRLLFYPKIPKTGEHTDYNFFRELSENSLGYNNLLYVATVLAELEGLNNPNILHKILLIEEPEAHLHPQLQIRLLQYLQAKANEKDMQVIVTTHSPTIVASINLDAINVLSLSEVGKDPSCTSVLNCGLKDDSKYFLERWLDITKSTLLFAKGILLVEGISEALIIPELAKIIIREKKLNKNIDDGSINSLEDYGVVVINMGGIYFDHFMQLFKGYIIDGVDCKNVDKINVKCAGITDCDPDKESKPTISNNCDCNNPKLYLVEELNRNSINCKLFFNLKTFEYDLAMQDSNLSAMNKILLKTISTDGSINKKAIEYASIDWGKKSDNEKAGAAYWLLQHIREKGTFAQSLAYNLSKDQIKLSVPDYIRQAVLWLLD